MTTWHLTGLFVVILMSGLGVAFLGVFEVNNWLQENSLSFYILGYCFSY